MSRFKPGQHVMVRPHASFAGRPGLYKIMRVLPKENSGQKYRIKSDREAFERILGESGLDAIE